MQSGEAPLVSHPRSAPRLIIVLDDGPLKAFVVADTITVTISATASKPLTMCDIVCTLLACYYAWDLNFPREYQMLTFLQENLLLDKREKHFKSTAHLKFLKMFQAGQQTA